MDEYTKFPRLYIVSGLKEQAHLTLSENCSHYLCNVLRKISGDFIRVFNEHDGEFLATLHRLHKSKVEIIIQQKRRDAYEEEGPTLFFAPIKKERLHFLVEKATELGVGSLVPVITHRTLKSNLHLDKIKAYTIEATEQCERMRLPIIHNPHSLKEVFQNWENRTPVFFCKERGATLPISQALKDHSAGPFAFLIGPEGGFTQEEIAFLEALPFMIPVHLGPRILRAETAALSVLSYVALRSGFEKTKG
jgi:16S rRNA (uracil1498-N3)-methyltransferase